MNVPPWGSPDVEALTSETSASLAAETYPPERHETLSSSRRRSHTFSGALGLPVAPLVRRRRLAFWLLRYQPHPRPRPPGSSTTAFWLLFEPHYSRCLPCSCCCLLLGVDVASL